jgi:hypothetical protein
MDSSTRTPVRSGQRVGQNTVGGEGEVYAAGIVDIRAIVQYLNAAATQVPYSIRYKSSCGLQLMCNAAVLEA